MTTTQHDLSKKIPFHLRMCYFQAAYSKGQLMMKFIELNVSEESEVKTQLINVSNIGRIYPNPQSTRKSIVELNYQSINDAPVYLEVEMPYDTLRSYFIG